MYLVVECCDIYSLKYISIKNKKVDRKRNKTIYVKHIYTLLIVTICSNKWLECYKDKGERI